MSFNTSEALMKAVQDCRGFLPWMQDCLSNRYGMTPTVFSGVLAAELKAGRLIMDGEDRVKASADHDEEVTVFFNHMKETGLFTDTFIKTESETALRHEIRLALNKVQNLGYTARKVEEKPSFNRVKDAVLEVVPDIATAVLRQMMVKK